MMDTAQKKDGLSSLMSKPVSSVARMLFVILSIAGSFSSNFAFGAVNQTFDLQPGWNAIYMNVAPDVSDPESVFGGIPGLQSVWTWNPNSGAAQYISDPAQLITADSNWLVYVPAALPESFLSSLFSIREGAAYLLYLEGSQPVAWVVSGQPKVSNIDWSPNLFNLVAFDVNPNINVSYASFFSQSSAHAGQDIYRLNNANGQWERVANPSATNMVSGEAFWIFTVGDSDFSGPVDIDLQQGRELDFGIALVEQSISLTNRAFTPDTVTLQLSSLQNPVALRYWDEGASPEEAQWKTLPGTLSFTLEGKKQKEVRLAVQRPAGSSGIDYTSILSVSTNSGAYQQIAVSASGRGAAGLWVGYATVNAVNEPASASPDVPTPTDSEFSFRLMLHVDETGQVRLLKQVVQMWRDGTTRSDPNDPSKLVVDQPGHYVLVTDDNLIQQYKGVALRDGRQVGRRLSTPAIDFPGNDLAMSGSFGAILNTTILITPDFATNPFKHRYHPDHDNLDPQGQPTEEALEVTRQIELTFTASDPNGLSSASWGDTEYGGTYNESLTGLHKNALNARGTFRLQRAALIPVLNQ